MTKNQFWLYAAVSVVLGAASFAEANYVIKLKNGNEYITTRYWQKGQQLFFDAYGGVFGVDKAFVTKIDKSSAVRPIRNETQDAPGIPEARTQTKKELEAAKGQEAEPKVEPQRSPDDSVVSEFNRLRERSRHVGNLLTSEILELLKEITAFKNKLSKDSKLFITYGREFNEAHEIADVVESALRSRTQ